MQATFLAPELSATSSTVCIWIMTQTSAFPCISASALTRTSATRQRFSLDIGRVSTIRTLSPGFADWCSSWHLYFFFSVMYLPYWPCLARRSTCTTTVFIILCSQLSGPADHPGVERQLVRGERHRFLRDLGRHAFHLVEHAAHLHHGDPLLDIPLAVAHARLGRLLGDRLVGEHPDPDLAAALDEAGHGDAARLDLARGEAARLEHLEAVVSEGELTPAVGLALVAALLLLAELRACWLHHGGVSRLLHRG